MGSRGQYKSSKIYFIDLPFSQRNFRKYFCIQYNGEISVKMSMAVSDMDNLFGENWHIVEFKNSSTRKRIIGLVIVHYRKKSIPKAMKMKYERFSTLLCPMIFFQQIFTKKRFRQKTSSKCMTLCCSLFQFIQQITGNWK